MDNVIKVLVVEDSAFMQRRIVELLESCPDIRVAGTARDGVEAIEQVNRVNPDVITMDLNMPRMDGLTAIENIMATCPKPIVILSSYSKLLGQRSFQALEIGAVDIVEKPGDSISLDLSMVREDLLRKLRTASRVKVIRNAGGPKCSEPNSSVKVCRKVKPIDRIAALTACSHEESARGAIVCIGSSTGGPGVLSKVLPSLPSNFSLPVVVAQHMPGSFMKPFIQQLASKCQVRVKEAEEGEVPQGGTVYVAPGFKHLGFQSAERFELHAPEVLPGPCPSVDVLFHSAALHFGSLAVGVLLTGMGSDGATGMRDILKRGGHTIAQDEESCVVFGMPKVAIDNGSVKEILPSHEIASAILRSASRVTRSVEDA